MRSLADLEPDLVVNTGDNLSHRDAVPVVTEALGAAARPARGLRLRLQRLLRADAAQPGALPAARHRQADRDTGRSCPGPTSSGAFVEAGWLDLTNRRDALDVGGTSFAFAGVDDPHLRYDRLDLVAGPAEADADVRLAVTHAPYLRVLDQFAADGYDAVIAGHTHGGQVCLPVRRRPHHQLRSRQRPRQGPPPASGRLPRRRPRQRVAARLGGRRHQPVRPRSASPAGPRQPS